VPEPELPDPDPAHAAARGHAILIADASREGEVIAEALRAKGFSVGELDAEMLEARALSETPRAILVDVDQPGVLEAVEHLLELSAGPPLEIFCLGDPMRAAEVGATRASGRSFARPIDVEAVIVAVAKVVAPEAYPRGRSSVPPDLHRRPTAPPRSRESEAPVPVSEQPSVADPFDAAALLPELDGTPSGGHLLPTELSPELRQILDDAEQRVAGLDSPNSSPSPDEEIDLLLPPEMLSALDEPIDPEVDGGTSSGAGTMGTPLPRRVGGSVAPGTGVPFGTHIGEKTEAGLTAARKTGQLDTTEPRTVTPLSYGTFADQGAGGRAAFTAPLAAEPLPVTLSPAPLPPAPPIEPLRRTSLDFAATASERPTPPPPRPGPTTGQLPRIARVAPPVMEAKTDLAPPVLLGEGDALRALSRAVATRVSGALSLGAEPVLRRIVLHEGDLVTAGSSAADETLVAFLVARGDMERGEAARLGPKLPPFGRHAGAALIAHGHLGQDDLWPVLRAHAEWIIGRALLIDSGVAELEAEPPGRYKAEPGVFGGATGAELLVEAVRRVIPPETAVRRLGGPTARLDEGPQRSLLGECALTRDEEALVRAAPGRTVGELLAGNPPELADLLYALVALGVLDALAPAVKPAPSRPGAPDPLDEEALRQRVRARMALVEDGDYFALLGVPRQATAYEIRRAYLELRRSFEPGRVLTAQTADLGPDVRVILDVLDEAYDILRDGPRRERYRKAIEAGPP
jgi:hypothetical protein